MITTSGNQGTPLPLSKQAVASSSALAPAETKY